MQNLHCPSTMQKKQTSVQATAATMTMARDTRVREFDCSDELEDEDKDPPSLTASTSA